MHCTPLQAVPDISWPSLHAAWDLRCKFQQWHVMHEPHLDVVVHGQVREAFEFWGPVANVEGPFPAVEIRTVQGQRTYINTIWAFVKFGKPANFNHVCHAFNTYPSDWMVSVSHACNLVG